MSESSVEKMLSPQQVADRLGISRHAVYSMIRDKRIEVIRLTSTNLKIRQSELDRYVAERTVPAGDAA